MALQFDALKLVVGYTCPFACKHCFTQSSPKNLEAMNQNTYAKCLTLFDLFDFRTLSFTGGEPVLFLQSIKDFIKATNEKKKCVYQITTGGAWLQWKDKRAAITQFLDPFHVYLSVDAYHFSFLSESELISFLEDRVPANGKTYFRIASKNILEFSDVVQKIPNKFRDQFEILPSPIFQSGRAKKYDLSSELQKVDTQKYCPHRYSLVVYPNEDITLCCSQSYFEGSLKKAYNFKIDDLLNKKMRHGVEEEFTLWQKQTVNQYFQQKGISIPINEKGVGLCDVCDQYCRKL